MSNTIYDLLVNCGVAKYKQRFDGFAGIEIETEATKDYVVPTSRYWNVVGDGSLRINGKEYVLAGPMSRREIDAALDEFAGFNRQYKFLKDSVATSVHVHMNMQGETFLTLANVLVTYTLMENLMIRICGETRLSNLFSLPICDAQAITKNFVTMLQSIARLNYRGTVFDANKVKYGALNPEPLPRLGSIEFRAFRGETDVNAIREWLDVLQELLTYSRRDGVTPLTILDLYRRQEHRMVHTIFPETGARLVRGLTDKQVDEAIVGREMVNLYSAAKMASVVPDWTNFGMPKPKKITTAVYKQKLNALAQDLYGKDYDTLDYAFRVVVEDHFSAIAMSNKTVFRIGDE